ncbi:hypothetical protein BFP70_12715 [Thioclava sp. SK-1]|uniref:DUF3772 domain-containing protein n=1 Tax=Thioclava sp. SK-1 TaxID=1889770 RepID=UPI00082511C0|nr:DUF3772 domain-containing protein [Thioclava sp. SK-1]OCX63072.1 hypothetical protein BFP70_12715 [Thioclava sp. SK-1]
MIRSILRLLAFVTCLAYAGLAAAQDSSLPDYQAWQSFADQAQTTLDEGKASDSELEALRQNIVSLRSEFHSARDANANQIQTLRDQIDALGPAPAEGDTEDEAIAARRKDLNDQLGKLQAPGITATEASTRADGLVRAIDAELRTRSTDKLLRLSPSPLNPINWASALTLTSSLVTNLYSETAERAQDTQRFEAMKDNGPVIAGLFFVSVILLWRGRSFMQRVSVKLLDRSSLRARMVIETVVSIGQIIVPMIGTTLFLTALVETDLFGSLWKGLIAVVGGIALIILFSAWLAGRIFPSRDRADSPFTLLAERRAEGRLLTLILGVLLAIKQQLGDWIIAQADPLMLGGGQTAQAASDAATRIDGGLAVLVFPLQVAACMALFRLGQLLRRHVHNSDNTDDAGAFRNTLIRLIATLILAVSIVSPVLGGIGYVNAANGLIWSTILSLMLAGVVLILQHFLAEMYVVVTKREDDGRDSLIPVLAGFLLGLLSLPVLALIWGARVEGLLEVWTAFRQGIDLGGVQISPAVFMTLAAVFTIGYMATRILQGALRTTILPKTTIDKGGQNAIVSGVGYLGVFLAALMGISAAGINLSSLAIVAGALSVGVGFGLQTIVQNFVSGIILLVERPISEGDWIEVGGQMGVVKAISVRSTRIETFDRTEVIVPNADLIANQVTNWTRGNMTGRLIVPVGVAYGTDTRKVEQILLEIAEAQPTVMLNPEPQVVFTSFGADSMNFEARVILSDVNFKLRVMSEMNHQINARFREEGIEIPFAQRDLWLRNAEVLTGRQPQPKPPEPKLDDQPHKLGTPAPGEGLQDSPADSGGADGDGGR